MNNLEKAEKLAQDKAEALKPKEPKKETEPKGAEPKEPEKVKEPEKAKEPDKEPKGKETEGSKSEEPKQPEKAVETEEPEDTDLSMDDKIKRIQEKTQKRIDEVISDLKSEKSLREQDQGKIAALEKELSSLRQPQKDQEVSIKVSEVESENLQKYLDEDKEKPLKNRREMSDDDLQEWSLEDFPAAQKWIEERTIRRSKEREEITKALRGGDAEEFIRKQQESLKKLVSKFPGVQPSVERLAELKGKSKEEIDEILSSENEEYATMMRIVNSDPKKYLQAIDGPELVMKQMEEQLSSRPKKDVLTLTAEELEQRIKEGVAAETQRLANLDQGVTSSGGRKVEREKQKTAFQLEQEKIAKRAGITLERLKEVQDRRESMNIMSNSSAEDFNKE